MPRCGPSLTRRVGSYTNLVTNQNVSNTRRPYFLGCPGWACDDWVDSFYSTGNRQRWLGQYTRVFNSVEGNSTFYGLPKLETVQRWADSAAEGFEFVLKFPRVISHDKELVHADRNVGEFLEVLQLLKDANRLGPAFLQLPPFFSGRQLPDLAAFLEKLPNDFHYSVETRHADYFDQGSVEREFTRLLGELKIDRMLFDSRALFSSPPTDEWEFESQTRKPRSPVRQTVTGSRPVLRLIGRNDIPSVRPWMEQWAKIVAGWIGKGLTPYIFTHAPNNAYAPLAARQFHSILTEYIPALPPLSDWPSEEVQKQQSLFE